MTTREKLESNLVNKGLMPFQAKEIMNLAIPRLDEVVPEYKTTWNRPFDEYPAAMYAVWQIEVNKVALEWIEMHCPNAWFKPMFQ